MRLAVSPKHIAHGWARATSKSSLTSPIGRAYRPRSLGFHLRTSAWNVGRFVTRLWTSSMALKPPLTATLQQSPFRAYTLTSRTVFASLCPLCQTSAHRTPVYIVCCVFIQLGLFTLHPFVAMINAVLVFNNNGQPRLTKFYSQLVRSPSLCLTPSLTLAAGYRNAAVVTFSDIHPCISSTGLCLQFPTSASSTGSRSQQWFPRCPDSDHLPALCDLVLYSDIHLHRVTVGPARFHPSLRRSPRQALCKRL